MRTLAERSDSEYEMFQRMFEKFGADLRVAMPGIVQSFDPIEQTVTVQPALKERVINQDGDISTVNLPLLLDVPVVFPRAGGFSLTMPVLKGDECLVVFSDMCIDSWWSQGGVQVQAEKRRHELSDGFAIMGVWSQPKIISNYSMTSAQLRSEDGSQRIEISATRVNLCGEVQINGEKYSDHIHAAPGGNTSSPL